jgi:hypothetical protein
MRTEIETNIERALTDLHNDYKDILTIVFGSNCSREDKTHCRKSDTTVYLQLIQPESHADLQKWGEEIVKAEEMCQKLTDEIAHEINHPNFFRAMQFKFPRK